MPEQSELLTSAAGAYREGRLDDAFLLARDVLEVHPGDLEAMLLVGVIAVRKHQLGIAIPMLTQLTERDPSSFLALHWLSVALRRTKKLNEALVLAEKAVALNPQEPQALFQLGMCHKELENWRPAETNLRNAAKISPQVSSIHYHLGQVLEQLGGSSDALIAYRRSVALNPSHSDALYGIGQILAHDLDYRSAEEHASRMLEIDPDSVPGHSLMATANVGLNKPTEATDNVKRLLELARNQPEVLTHCATILQAIGQPIEAEELFRRSIEFEPRQGFGYYALVRTRKVVGSDCQLVSGMETVAGDPTLARRHRGYIEYALGKAYGDLGDYQTAMSHYDEANRVTRKQKLGQAEFDIEVYRQGVDFAIRNLDGNFMARCRNAGSPDELPVFVVGMMRSGTTLVEQILSSHPEIGGAGEQRFWSENRGELFRQLQGGVHNEDPLSAITKDYLEILKGIAPGKSRVVDKLPENYAHVGLIHAALPNARIIHIRRHPIDTCLSIWTTPNSTRVPWTNDKQDIVFVYKEYRRLMEHWRETVGGDRLLEIDYEALVTEQERVSRQMIDFCGLTWDDRCLRPEENKRAVATPSDWQVRQPIYQTAIERWRPYEPWLGEFMKLLPVA